MAEENDYELFFETGKDFKGNDIIFGTRYENRKRGVTQTQRMNSCDIAFQVYPIKSRFFPRNLMLQEICDRLNKGK